jgi:hypothetical protein
MTLMFWYMLKTCQEEFTCSKTYFKNSHALNHVKNICEKNLHVVKHTLKTHMIWTMPKTYVEIQGLHALTPYQNMLK